MSWPCVCRKPLAHVRNSRKHDAQIDGGVPSRPFREGRSEALGLSRGLVGRVAQQPAVSVLRHPACAHEMAIVHLLGPVVLGRWINS